MMNPRYDLIIVGHLTIDLIKFENQERSAMGGPPAYGMVGPAIGLKQVGIVSRIGKEFPPKYYNSLAASGLNLDGLLLSEETTQFINIYNKEGDRTQYVSTISGPILSSDIPKPYWNTQWMHISPVLGEVDSSLIITAKKYGAKVSVDAQGFVRKRSIHDHAIIGCDWSDFYKIVSHIDVLKADIDEITRLGKQSTFQDAAKSINQKGCPLILITQGQRGSFLYQDSEMVEIPAIPPDRVVDHTGSGDVFAISFLSEYQRSKRPLWSAFFASSSASYNVETPGPTNFPSYDAVINRLRAFLSIKEHRHYTEQLLNEPGPTECPL